MESRASLGDLFRNAIVDEAAYTEPLNDRGEWYRWRVPAVAGVLVAAAAALLLWVSGSSTTAQDMAEKIAEGPVQIEHLDVGAANAVRVLQLGDDSPTIILIKDGAEKIDVYPWLLIFPALFFSATLFSLNFIGDGLRDALDPKSSKD